jgi:hypothetical protein
MKRDDDSLDSTLDRYMRQAGEPPAGQVASSVEEVWERLRLEAECSVPPAREIVTGRSHFIVAAAVVIATVAIGLYAAQRTGLLQAMLPLQQRAQPQVAPASRSSSISADPMRGPVPIGGVAESNEPTTTSKPGQIAAAAVNAPALSKPRPLSSATVAAATLPQGTDAGAGLVQLTDGKPSQGMTTPVAPSAASIRLVPPPIPHYEVEILQTLSTERFKLTVHRETEESTVYTLVVAKNGPILQDTNGGGKSSINWTGQGQVTFSETTALSDLIGVLSGVLGAPVFDETGLNGTYTFSLEFTSPRDPRPRQTNSPPDLFTAVQEQLGLELLATKRRVEIVVIDKLERPSPN